MNSSILALAMSSPKNPLASSAVPPPRPVAGFQPSMWGDRFLDYTPDSKVTESQQEIAKELKQEINRELLQSLGDHKPLKEKLCLIDSIERLGVGYHFEKEILDALRYIHEMSTSISSDDLVLTSLHFRLLRQHGFRVSCDIFTELVGTKARLGVVGDDVQGMLSLYEACHVRGNGEEILEEALTFTISKLTSIANQSGNLPLGDHIRRALHKPLQKRLTRVESVHYMKVYEQDPLHNKTLLKFAKLDFNLLQDLHKKELSEVYRWWKDIGVITKLPLRDRIVESYFWATGVYYEPQYSIGRKICAMGSQILTTIDDIYDAYGTLEELEIFTQAVQRWDESCLDELPEDLRWCYQTILLDAYEEMERLLAPKGRSKYVHYAREEMKALCKSYLIEARWRHNKYIPTPDEYMGNVHRNTAYVAATVFSFTDVDTATDREFEWVSKLPSPVKAICFLLRILDDIAGNADKMDQERGHSSLLLEYYKKRYGVSNERAWKELYEKTEELWKDINEAMSPPTEVPMPLLKCVLNYGRALETIYDAGEDGFTSNNKAMIDNIENLFSIPY